jgi:hypothetical protein
MTFDSVLPSTLTEVVCQLRVRHLFWLVVCARMQWGALEGNRHLGAVGESE